MKFWLKTEEVGKVLNGKMERFAVSLGRKLCLVLIGPLRLSHARGAAVLTVCLSEGENEYVS